MLHLDEGFGRARRLFVSCNLFSILSLTCTCNSSRFSISRKKHFTWFNSPSLSSYPCISSTFTTFPQMLTSQSLIPHKPWKRKPYDKLRDGIRILRQKLYNWGSHHIYIYIYPKDKNFKLWRIFYDNGQQFPMLFATTLEM